MGRTQPAVEAGEVLRKSALVTIVSVDDESREKAWRLFKKYSDQDLSFADCTSFATMEKFRIGEAFSFDDDFRKVGYRCIPNKRDDHR